MVAGRRAGHLPLSPMDLRCCVAYQLGSAEFPLLKGFDRPWMGFLHSAQPFISLAF